MKELVHLEFKAPLDVHNALKQNWGQVQKVLARIIKIRTLLHKLESERDSLDKEHNELMERLMEF